MPKLNRSHFNYKVFQNKFLDNDLPIYFGANYEDDPLMISSLRKSHTLSTRACGDRVPDDYAPHTSYTFNGEAINERYLHNPMDDTQPKYLSTLSGVNQMSLAEARLRGSTALPGSRELQFLGYFKEPVVESQVETTRVRKVALTYYADDNSFMITEAKQINSGMPQGVFLSRQQVPKDGSDGKKCGLYGSDDLHIGNILHIYGRDVCLVDCDVATRQFLEEKRGHPLAASISWPDEEDIFNTQYMPAKMAKNASRKIPTFDMENKRALESLKSGGQITKHDPDDVRCAQQFYATKIGQHFSLAALWDDREKINGDLHYVVIKYYLENDTVQIIEQVPDNAGKDGGAVLLGRQRLLKPDSNATDSKFQQNTFGVLLKNDYMTAKDFNVGFTVNIHGRDYFIYDCDEFTRNYYKQIFNINLMPKVDIQDIELSGKPQHKDIYPAPYNGYGTEEDSLQNCKLLILKPPRKDYDKLWRNMDKSLVFLGKLVTKSIQDAEREFVITFYLDTDDIQINELSIRSGNIIGGRFLAKGRYMKELPDGNRLYFCIDDFQVGKDIVICGRRFKLISMDERSRKMLEGIEDPLTTGRIQELVLMFRTLIATKFVVLADAFCDLAPKGILTAAELVDFYARSSCKVTEKEAANVLHYIHDYAHSVPIVEKHSFVNRTCPWAPVQGTQKMRELTKQLRNIKMPPSPVVSNDYLFTMDQQRCYQAPASTISYDDFLRFIDATCPGGTSTMQAASNSAVNVKGVDLNSFNPEFLHSTVQNKVDIRRNYLKKLLLDKMNERRGTVQEIFRLMAGPEFNGKLGKRQFIRGMRDILHMTYKDQETQMVVDELFRGREDEKGELSFVEFSKFMDTE